MKHQFRYKNIYFEQQKEKYLGKQIFIGFHNYRPVCYIKWDSSWKFYGRSIPMTSSRLQDVAEFLMFLNEQEE